MRRGPVPVGVAAKRKPLRRLNYTVFCRSGLLKKIKQTAV
jgi:hypothetical protein